MLDTIEVRKSRVFLAKLSKDLEQLPRVLWQLGYTKGEVDEVREHINTLNAKIEKVIEEIDSFLEEESGNLIIDEKKLEKYVAELEEHIKFSHKILTSVMKSIEPILYQRITIAGKDLVLSFEDAESLINFAILKTIEVLKREGDSNAGRDSKDR